MVGVAGIAHTAAASRRRRQLSTALPPTRPPPTHLQHLLPIQADEVFVHLLGSSAALARLLAPRLLVLLPSCQGRVWWGAGECLAGSTGPAARSACACTSTQPHPKRALLRHLQQAGQVDVSILEHHVDQALGAVHLLQGRGTFAEQCWKAGGLLAPTQPPTLAEQPPPPSPAAQPPHLPSRTSESMSWMMFDQPVRLLSRLISSRKPEAASASRPCSCGASGGGREGCGMRTPAPTLATPAAAAQPRHAPDSPAPQQAGGCPRTVRRMRLRAKILRLGAMTWREG